MKENIRAHATPPSVEVASTSAREVDTQPSEPQERSGLLHRELVKPGIAIAIPQT